MIFNCYDISFFSLLSKSRLETFIFENTNLNKKKNKKCMCACVVTVYGSISKITYACVTHHPLSTRRLYNKTKKMYYCVHIRCFFFPLILLWLTTVVHHLYKFIHIHTFCEIIRSTECGSGFAYVCSRIRCVTVCACVLFYTLTNF